LLAAEISRNIAAMAFLNQQNLAAWWQVSAPLIDAASSPATGNQNAILP